MFLGPHHGRLSLVSLWVPGFLRLPMARSWRFGVRGALSSMLSFSGITRIASVFRMCIEWRLYETVQIWKLKIPLGIGKNLSCLTFLL